MSTDLIKIIFPFDENQLTDKDIPIKLDLPRTGYPAGEEETVGKLYPSSFEKLKNKRTMLLVNWFQANVLMIFTVIILLGIPIVAGIIAFSKHKGPEADIEKYRAEHPEAAEEESETAEKEG